MTAKQNTQQSTGILLIAVLCFAFCMMACHKEKHEQVETITDRKAMPVLIVDTVTTLISDSGITRYRIKSPRWEIYDKAKPAHWIFPNGIYLERFNEALETEASLEADSAYYDEDAQFWRLRGNVHAMNLEGEKFETPLLMWSQKTERVYSDTIIKITRETSIITGIGFESNQDMTKYTILKPQGVFPIKENNDTQLTDNETITE